MCYIHTHDMGFDLLKLDLNTETQNKSIRKLDLNTETQNKRIRRTFLGHSECIFRSY